MLAKVRKVFCLILVLVMLLTSVPGAAFAVGMDDSVAHGIESVIALSEPDNYLLRNENRFNDDRFAEHVLDEDRFFYLEPCEQIFSTTTLDDTFVDDAVIVVFNRATSRENRDFTVTDFSDVGAVYVEDLTRLSDIENAYAQTLWYAEHQMYIAAISDANRMDSLSGKVSAELNNQISAETRMAIETYESAREEAEENNFRNFDAYRQSLLIRLDQNCKENVLRVIEQLRYREYIRWVGPNYIAWLPEMESDNVIENSVSIMPFSFENQWAVDLINLQGAWNITRGSSNVVVGVMDTGINPHPDFGNRVSMADNERDGVRKYGNFTDDNINNGRDIRMPRGHGTQAAGVIGAGGTEVAGMAPNVRMISMRVFRQWPDFNDVGLCFAAKERAIEYATFNRIPILYAGTQIAYPHSFPQNIIDAVDAYEGLFVQAAGNFGRDISISRPLPETPHVIVVGASDRNDRRWVWNDYPLGHHHHQSSNYGSTGIHLFAPTGVQTTGPNGNHVYYSGTSGAAPHVAGVAALILSVNPDLSATDVREIILSTVDGPAEGVTAFANISTSGGRLNAYRAVRAARATNDDFLFPDVPPGHWARGYIEAVARNGIMIGNERGHFRPYGGLQRAEIAAIVGRIYSPNGLRIPDVEDTFADTTRPSWYTKHVAWASQNGIIHGIGNNQFNPYGPVLRAELATMLFRYETFRRNGNPPTFNSNAFYHFPDQGNVPDWARPAMDWAVYVGIITGRPDGTLAPLDPVVRAEAATMVIRYLERTQQLLQVLGGFARISLNPANNHTFPAATVGYGAQAARSVTVSSTGDRATDHLTVTLSGTNRGSFQLNTASANVHNITIQSMSAGGSASFTVRPRTGLAAGTHTATVTVSGANVATQSFTVTFTVNAAATRVITFNFNGNGQANQTRNVANATPWTTFRGLGTATGIPAQPTRAGFTFAGWFNTSAATGGTNITAMTGNIAANHTFWARWTPVATRTITFNFNGNGQANQTRSAPDATPWTTFRGRNTTTGIPIQPTRAGHEFVGWFNTSATTGGTNINNMTGNIVGNHTFWARWQWRLNAPASLRHNNTFTHNSVTLTWDAVAGAQFYRIERTLDGGATWHYDGTVAAPQTSVTRTGLTALRAHGYRVVAQASSDRNNPGNSIPSPQVWFTTRLAPVSPWTSNITQNSVQINWTGVSGGRYYHVEQLVGSSWVHRTTTTAGFFHATGLSANAAHRFRVRSQVGSVSDWGSDSAWAEVTVQTTRSLSGNIFAADEVISYAMAMTILYHLAESSADIYDSMFENILVDEGTRGAASWAYDNDIVQSDGEEYFVPDDPITKEQLVTMLYRFAKLMEHDVEVPEGFTLDSTDADLVSNCTAEAMLWASYLGLIEATDDGTLDLAEVVDGAEYAIILQRFIATFEE